MARTPTSSFMFPGAGRADDPGKTASGIIDALGAS